MCPTSNPSLWYGALNILPRHAFQAHWFHLTLATLLMLSFVSWSIRSINSHALTVFPTCMHSLQLHVQNVHIHHSPHPLSPTRHYSHTHQLSLQPFHPSCFNPCWHIPILAPFSHPPHPMHANCPSMFPSFLAFRPSIACSLPLQRDNSHIQHCGDIHI